jgi:MFS family permease
MPRGLAPLRHRGFRLLAAGQLTSNFGDAFYAVALPWYVLAGHGGTLLLGTVLIAYALPRTALLTIGGQASDRWQPWTVMMVSDGMRTVATILLAVAAFSGPPSAVLLVPIAVVLGAGEGLFLPGSFAIAPALVPDDDLQAANAALSGGTQLATLAGPALGGGVVALIGPAPAFSVDAVTFLVSALTLAAIRHSAVRPLRAAARTELGTSTPRPTLLSMLRSERVLQMMVVVTVGANLGDGGASAVALPSLAHGPLRASATGYGALIAALAGGALMGTLIAGQARQVARPVVVAALAYVGQALLIGVVPYAGVLGGIVPVAVALAGLGLLNAFANVLMITAYQRWAPPDLLGRVTGLLMLSAFGIFPVSVALATLVVHDFGPAPFFPLAGAALAAALLAGLGQRDWRNLGRPHTASADAPVKAP